MMNKKILLLLMAATITFTSCRDNATERLEDKMENKSEALEERADDLEDAADDISDAAEDIEEAMENFRDALEELDNPEDRMKIRKRINEIMDEMNIKEY